MYCLFAIIQFMYSPILGVTHTETIKAIYCIVGYTYQENIYDVTGSVVQQKIQLYRLLRTHPQHCSMVLEYS